MEKEAKPLAVKSPELLLKNLAQASRLKQREQLRQEFMQLQKEKYKKNEAKQDKKDVISKLKEVFSSES